MSAHPYLRRDGETVVVRWLAILARWTLGVVALPGQIESWARSSSRAVHLLYHRLRLAKEIQLNMWVRFCRSAAALAGGRLRGGVTIRTRVFAFT